MTITGAVSFPYAFLGLYALPYFVTAVLILALGIFVFYHNRKSPTHIAYLFVCTSAFIWLGGNYLAISALNERVGLFWAKFAYIGVTMLPPCVFWFAVTWLGLYEKRKVIVALNFLAGTLFVYFLCLTDRFVVGVRQFFFGYFSKLSSLGLLYLLYFFCVFGGFFWTLVYGYVKETNATRKVHIRNVLIAFAVAFIGSIDFLISYGLSVYPVSFLTISFFVFMIAYTIISYRLMDIKTVVHKTIMWFLTSLVLIAPFVFIFYLMRKWLLGFEPSVLVGIFTMALIVFSFYARMLQPKIDHFFQRRRWDLSEALERFNDELVHLKDLDQLARHIAETVKTVLYVPEVSLLVRYENSNDFVFAVKTSAETPVFESGNEFLKWLSANDTIVFRDQVAVDSRLEAVAGPASAYFETTGAELSIPLVVGGNLIGVLNMGSKENLKRYRFAEISFLSDLRRSAAIALSNSLHLVALQENLRRWNVELEKQVTERTKELVETQQQLIQAEKLATLGTLAGGVAHEINNPLTAVLTNAQILKMDARPEDLESLNLIEDGAKRCRMIVQKMMKYARKSEGMETVEKVDLNKAVASVVHFVKYQFEQDNVALSVAELNVSAAPVILGNMNELEQVLTNLLLNAKDATQPVDGVRKVSVKVTGGDGERVGFTVSDNGVGIPKENLSKIFDPFFTTKDVGKGTGLGLAVTQSIVQKFSGRIEVASEIGKGTTFTISFPTAPG